MNNTHKFQIFNGNFEFTSHSNWCNTSLEVWYHSTLTSSGPRDFFGWEILISASISQGAIGVLKLLIWYWLNFGGWYISRNLSVSFRLLSFVCLASYFFTCFTSVEFSLVSLFYFQVLNYPLHFITLLVCVFKEFINGKNSCYLWEDLISRTQRSKHETNANWTNEMSRQIFKHKEQMPTKHMKCLSW